MFILFFLNPDQGLGNDLFAFKLNYNSLDLATNSVSLYNGNISETLWKTANDDNTTLRGYGYHYDKLNRLLQADYVIKIAGSFAYPIDYREHMTYDLNGNIESLYRGSAHAELIDELSYTYDGNQLLSVTDSAMGPNRDQGLFDLNTAGNDYIYDTNGNMTQDLNKGIFNIKYNHLNLPTEVGIAGAEHTGNIKYVYDATGVKLSKQVNTGNSLNGPTTEYAGNFIYERSNLSSPSVLKMFSQPEGYVEPDGNGGYSYVYQYKDHLGNIRLTYLDNNGALEIIEENNYYPFGLKHKGYNDMVSANVNSQASKYKYSGKELNDELGLDWYDFGARNYEASLGRWMNIDALSEDYYPVSPYIYAVNNPIFFVDPDGNKIIIYYGENQDQEQEYAYEKDRDYSGMDSFLADAYKALDALYEATSIEVDGEEVNLLDALIDDKKELSVVKGGEKFGSHFAKGRKYLGNGEWKDGQSSVIGTVHFNSELGVLFDDTNDTKGTDLKKMFENDNLPSTAKVNSPTSLLGHEISHAYNWLTKKRTKNGSSHSYFDRQQNAPYEMDGFLFRNQEEARATTMSTQINIKLKENPRKNHRGYPVKTKEVTSNKPKKTSE